MAGAQGHLLMGRGTSYSLQSVPGKGAPLTLHTALNKHQAAAALGLQGAAWSSGPPSISGALGLRNPDVP